MSVFLFCNIQWDGREQKVGFTEQQLRLWHTGLNRVRRQVGGLPFWVFAVGIIWRRDDPIGLPGLFGFGPKRGCFVVQKRNETPETPETLETPETPETLCVVVRIAFL